VAVIAHWACPEHPDQANTYYSMDAVGWRCNVCDEEAVRVDVVPAEQLRGAVEALRLIADPPMGDDYTAPREYAEWLRDQARRALADLGGQ
jgi:hypothetical protein